MTNRDNVSVPILLGICAHCFSIAVHVYCMALNFNGIILNSLHKK